MRWADAHRLNTYSHQHFDKVAQNSLKVLNGDVMTLDNGAMRMALPWDFIEGIAVTTDIFASDNETGEKRTVNYRPVFRQNTYKLESLPWQTFSIADVGKFFQLAIWPDGTQYADHASANPSSWQFRLEWVIDDLWQFVEVRFVPTTWYQPAIAWAPANVISYNNPICWTPVANVQDALDEITAILCPTANLAHVPTTITSPSWSITTWASGADSQTLEVDVDLTRLQGQVSAMETQTTLDQVDIISSGNIITSTVYYTWENGNAQAQSDSTTIINTWNFLSTPTGLKIEINWVTIWEVPRSAISPNIIIDTNDTLNISSNNIWDLILTFTDDSNANSDQQTFNLTQYFWVSTSTDANGVTTITQNGVPITTIHSHINGNWTVATNNPNGTVAIDLAVENDLVIVNWKLRVWGTLITDTTTTLAGNCRIWEEGIRSFAIVSGQPRTMINNSNWTRRLQDGARSYYHQETPVTTDAQRLNNMWWWYTWRVAWTWTTAVTDVCTWWWNNSLYAMRLDENGALRVQAPSASSITTLWSNASWIAVHNGNQSLNRRAQFIWWNVHIVHNAWGNAPWTSLLILQWLRAWEFQQWEWSWASVQLDFIAQGWQKRFNLRWCKESTSGWGVWSYNRFMRMYAVQWNSDSQHVIRMCDQTNWPTLGKPYSWVKLDGTSPKDVFFQARHYSAQDQWLLLKRALFDIDTSFAYAIKTVSANYTLEQNDVTLLVDTSWWAVTINIPNAVECPRRILNIKNIWTNSWNTVTINPSVSTIDGTWSYTLTSDTADPHSTWGAGFRMECATIQSDGTNRYVI